MYNQEKEKINFLGFNFEADQITPSKDLCYKILWDEQQKIIGKIYEIHQAFFNILFDNKEITDFLIKDDPQIKKDDLDFIKNFFMGKEKFDPYKYLSDSYFRKSDELKKGYGKSDGDEISDSPFFYPLDYTLRKLAKEIFKAKFNSEKQPHKVN